ncbi:S-adenosyl-L-methionine-dependent methyltransferase [Wilcoxina mikolae CBS 423.85]|nr:S-adenosyl-L-methionine-dependent methyltransferase [Wilcoxina mikolae CBS 423.85]
MKNQHKNTATTIGFDVIEVITNDGDAFDHDPLDDEDEDEDQDENEDEDEDHAGSLEVDPEMATYDNDLDYGSSSDESYCTYRESLTSSVHQYIMENGRRYHAYFGIDKYLLPTDEKEQERLDMHHEIMLALLGGKLHLAPLASPKYILDVGTGTGIWAIDMADTYPDAEVIGTDLSPIQPEWVPPNCKFEVDDAEQEWAYQPDCFDFIHVRNLVQSISDWPEVMSEIYRCTKPGGWVELAEAGTETFSDDNTLGNAFVKFHEYLNEAMLKIGRPPATAALLRQRLEDAGFVDVRAVDFKQPFGPWPKDQRMKTIGAMFLLNAETGMEAYGMVPFTRVLGTMDVEEAQKICREGLTAARNMNHHMYTLFHVAYGRKPSTIDDDWKEEVVSRSKEGGDGAAGAEFLASKPVSV